jgi:arabinose-5-phosphate isomerase
MLPEVLKQLEPNFDACVQALLELPGKVVVTGVGKSGIIAHKIAATFASTGTQAVFIHAAEALHGDLGLLQRGDALMLISASGATPEVLRLMDTAKTADVLVVGLIGKPDTPLHWRCDHALNVTTAETACPLSLAPMNSTTAALVTGDALAAALMVAQGFTAEDFAANHPGGVLGRRLLLSAADVMHTGEALPTVSPQASLHAVLLEMMRPNLGLVCVTSEEGLLLGVISDGDIRRALLQDPSLSGNAASMMSTAPKTAPETTLLGDLLDQMEQWAIYCVAITDASNRLIGLVRTHDILSERP